MKKIKIFLEMLWVVKTNILQIFLFLLVISLCGNSHYSLLKLLLIDIVLSIIIVSVFVMKSWVKYFKQK